MSLRVEVSLRVTDLMGGVYAEASESSVVVHRPQDGAEEEFPRVAQEVQAMIDRQRTSFDRQLEAIMTAVDEHTS